MRPRTVPLGSPHGFSDLRGGQPFEEVELDDDLRVGGKATKDVDEQLAIAMSAEGRERSRIEVYHRDLLEPGRAFVSALLPKVLEQDVPRDAIEERVEAGAPLEFIDLLHAPHQCLLQQILDEMILRDLGLEEPLDASKVTLDQVVSGLTIATTPATEEVDVRVVLRHARSS